MSETTSTTENPAPAPVAVPAEIVTTHEAFLAPQKVPTDWGTVLRFVGLFTLGASVFALSIMGKVPYDTYLQTIVYPGLGALGVHYVAKNLN